MLPGFNPTKKSTARADGIKEVLTVTRRLRDNAKIKTSVIGFLQTLNRARQQSHRVTAPLTITGMIQTLPTLSLTRRRKTAMSEAALLAESRLPKSVTEVPTLQGAEKFSALTGAALGTAVHKQVCQIACGNPIDDVMPETVEILKRLNRANIALVDAESRVVHPHVPYVGALDFIGFSHSDEKIVVGELKTGCGSVLDFVGNGKKIGEELGDLPESGLGYAFIQAILATTAVQVSLSNLNYSGATIGGVVVVHFSGGNVNIYPASDKLFQQRERITRAMVRRAGKAAMDKARAAVGYCNVPATARTFI